MQRTPEEEGAALQDPRARIERLLPDRVEEQPNDGRALSHVITDATVADSGHFPSAYSILEQVMEDRLLEHAETYYIRHKTLCDA